MVIIGYHYYVQFMLQTFQAIGSRALSCYLSPTGVFTPRAPSGIYIYIYIYICLYVYVM